MANAEVWETVCANYFACYKNCQARACVRKPSNLRFAATGVYTDSFPHRWRLLSRLCSTGTSEFKQQLLVAREGPACFGGQLLQGIHSGADGVHDGADFFKIGFGLGKGVVNTLGFA